MSNDKNVAEEGIGGTGATTIQRATPISIDLGNDVLGYTLDLGNNKLRFVRGSYSGDRDYTITGTGIIVSTAYYPVLIQGATETDASSASMTIGNGVTLKTEAPNGCALLVYQGAATGTSSVDLSGVDGTLEAEYLLGFEAATRQSFTKSEAEYTANGFTLTVPTSVKNLNVYAWDDETPKDVDQATLTEDTESSFDAITAGWKS